MANLVAAHFPLEGNEDWLTAGTRTPYPKLHKTLPLDRDSLLWTDGGRLDLKAGDELEILQPPRLFDCLSVGAPRGTFTLVDCHAGRGHVQISHIGKPPGGQPRIASGTAHQEAVASFIQARAGDVGINLQLDHMAPASSQRPDLIFVGDADIQVEVKGLNSNKPITLFDQSIRLGECRPTLDKATDILIDSKKLPVEPGAGSFFRAIDYCKSIDGRVCLAGERAKPKGAAFPTELFLADRPRGALPMLRAHFASKGDQYLAVSRSDTESVIVYHTGLGANVLEAPSLPRPKRFGLQPYGGGYRGATRVGVVAQFE